MALVRTDHWATREYFEFLTGREGAPFSWGSNDCALFAADGIQAFTGTDLAAPFRGLYSDEAGALATIASVTGGSTIADAAAWCAAQHGLEELAKPLMAQRGDLVIVSGAGGDIAGLIHLSGRHVVSVGEAGMKKILIQTATDATTGALTSNIRRAWRV